MVLPAPHVRACGNDLCIHRVLGVVSLVVPIARLLTVRPGATAAARLFDGHRVSSDYAPIDLGPR